MDSKCHPTENKAATLLADMIAPIDLRDDSVYASFWSRVGARALDMLFYVGFCVIIFVIFFSLYLAYENAISFNVGNFIGFADKYFPVNISELRAIIMFIASAVAFAL